MGEQTSHECPEVVSRHAELLAGAFNMALVGSLALNACAPMPSNIRTQDNGAPIKRNAKPSVGAPKQSPQEVISRLLAKLQLVSKATLATNRASVLSNNGASIISHNGGNIVSNNGGNIISHNGGNYRASRPLQYDVLALRRAIDPTPRDGETMTRNDFDEETNLLTVEYVYSTNDLRRLAIEAGIVPRSEVLFKKVTRHGNGRIKGADISLISQDETGFFEMALDGRVKLDVDGQILELTGTEAELLSEDIGTIRFSKFNSTQNRNEVSAVFAELNVSVDATVSVSIPPDGEGSPVSLGEFRYRTINGEPLYVNKESTNENQSGQVSREYDLHDGFLMNLSTTDLENVDRASFTGTASYRGEEVATVEMKNNPSGVVAFTVTLKESPRSPKVITYGPGDLEAEKSAITTHGVSVRTIAGQREVGLVDGVGSTARFDHPRGLALTSAGDLLVADSGNGQIRRITPGGVVTTLSDMLQGIELTSVLDVAVDSKGSISFTDGHGHKIFQFQSEGPTIYYGSGYGFADTQPGPWPKFAQPLSMATGDGKLFIADTMNHCIRLIANDAVSTIAGNREAAFADGNKAAASFDRPMGLALDNQGNLIVADSGNNRIRRVSPSGVVSTIAGSGLFGFKDGTVTEAQFRHPTGVAVDRLDNIYVADTFNNRIRLITPSGVVSTLAGTGDSGFQDGDGETAEFRLPCDVVVDRDFKVFVADLNNNVIREIKWR